MAKIYVASSWRNPHFEEVAASLEIDGHTVWNWKQPPTGGNGFKWQDAGANEYAHGDTVDPAAWRTMLASEPAQRGFASDLSGMYGCDFGVLVLPAGRSSHLEAGWLAGQGKKVHIYAPEFTEPDLMVLLLHGEVTASIDKLLWLCKRT